MTCSVRARWSTRHANKNRTFNVLIGMTAEPGVLFANSCDSIGMYSSRFTLANGTSIPLSGSKNQRSVPLRLNRACLNQAARSFLASGTTPPKKRACGMTALDSAWRKCLPSGLSIASESARHQASASHLLDVFGGRQILGQRAANPFRGCVCEP